MLKRAAGWMPWTSTTLTLLVSSCVIGSNPAAICDGTVRLRDRHADALLADGGDQSVQSGAALIGTLDAYCQDV